MRSDLTILKGEEAILRVATELFADEGSERVTIRAIAAAAGVSPALVIHHFGSRAGLRDAVVQRVVARFVDLIAQLDGLDLAASASGLGAVLAQAADDEPAMFSFFRRLLIEGGPSADAAFASLFATTRRTMAGLDALGATRPTDDVEVRAAFLLVNDLAVLLLRDRIAEAIGADPLAADGLRRWSDQVMDVYTHGIFRSSDAGGREVR
jgi:AcrR family transcriptional regulator